MHRLPPLARGSYAGSMRTVSPSVVRARLREYIELAQREPVEITARNGARLAVIVSPAFFDRAFAALEDRADRKAAAAARAEGGVVAYDDLMREVPLPGATQASDSNEARG